MESDSVLRGALDAIELSFSTEPKEGESFSLRMRRNSRGIQLGSISIKVIVVLVLDGTTNVSGVATN